MRLLVHVMPWFGDGNIHRIDSYASNSATVVKNQIDILFATRVFGLQVQGAILTWQGPYAAFQHSTVMQWNTQCAARGMLFALLMDPYIASIGPTPPPVTGNSATDHVIQALNHVDSQTMLNASCYVPEKYILDFNTGANLTQLATQFPNLQFLAQGSGFAWPSINMSLTQSEARNQDSVNNLQGQHQHPAMRVPAVGMGFRDNGEPTPVGVSASAWTGTRDYNTSVWGGQAARVLDTQGGKLGLDYFATVPGSAPYLGFVTWNDYDEGTQIEDFWAVTTGVRIGS